MWGGLEWDNGMLKSISGGFKDGIAWVYKKEVPFIIDWNGKIKTN